MKSRGHRRKTGCRCRHPLSPTCRIGASLSKISRRATQTLVAAAVSAAALLIPATAATATAELPNAWSFSETTHAHLVEDGYAVLADDRLTVDGEFVAEVAAGLDVVNYSATGYDRDLFAHWSDLDGNGFDTRDDILIRDLTNVTYTEYGDHVATGTLVDPYTGTTINFQRSNYPTRGQGNSMAVQVDHIVPLSAAWTGGANTWDAEQREVFANDPANLIAVDGPTNSSKGDRLPGEWMPENADYQCLYVAQVTSVLDTYDLAVTQLDQDALISTGEACAIEAAPVQEETEPAATEDATPTDSPAATDPTGTADTADATSGEETLVETGADSLTAVIGISVTLVMLGAATFYVSRKFA